MNWNVVCNGGVTIAALALADVPRYAGTARRALQYAAQGIPLAVSGYGPAGNGAWPEGPGYWVRAEAPKHRVGGGSKVVCQVRIFKNKKQTKQRESTRTCMIPLYVYAPGIDKSGTTV